MQVNLYRHTQDKDCTRGVMLLNELPICVTLEEPWQDNAPMVSCIPAGTYKCVKYSSTAHPDVWELQNVPNRTKILIHNGNTLRDTMGCILVGNQTGLIAGAQAVLNSKKTLNKLRKILPDNFTLTIFNPMKG